MDPATGLKLCWIPPGRFVRDSFVVTLSKGFWMGKYEVTQGEYQAVMGVNPSYFVEVGLQAPVERVSWEEAMDFIKRLNAKGGALEYRLPTEAQWEYACRAGTTTRYAFGDALGSEHANFDWSVPENAPKAVAPNKTMPVGRFPANAWGLHDMHGNIFEWCADWADNYPQRATVDPTGGKSGERRVLRGGSWWSWAIGCRSALRGAYYPDRQSYWYGFRVIAVERKRASVSPK